MEKDIIFRENCLTPSEIVDFQIKLGWPPDPFDLWAISLRNTVYSVSAYRSDELIAMGRLLGDRAMYWYINDMFVLAKYQGQGIGSKIIAMLLDYVRQNAFQKYGASVCLMCARDKEGFYEKLGFTRLPNSQMGHGMEMEITV